MALKKKQIKKPSKAVTRYRTVQKLLSDYTKASGVKLGRSFNKVAAEIYRKTAGSPLKYLKQNIEQLYKLHGEGIVKIKIPVDFPVKEDTSFYNFRDEMDSPQYEGVQVTISMMPGMLDNPDWRFTGDAISTSDYYNDNIHRYMRQNYNSSPPGVYRLIKTDNKTFVEYEFQPGEIEVLAEPKHLDVEKEIEEGGLDTLPPSEKLNDVDSQIKLRQLELELEKEKQRTIDKQLQLERMKTMQELSKAGFTAAEIKSLMNI